MNLNDVSGSTRSTLAPLPRHNDCVRVGRKPIHVWGEADRYCCETTTAYMRWEETRTGVESHRCCCESTLPPCLGEPAGDDPRHTGQADHLASVVPQYSTKSLPAHHTHGLHMHSPSSRPPPCASVYSLCSRAPRSRFAGGSASVGDTARMAHKSEEGAHNAKLICVEHCFQRSVREGRPHVRPHAASQCEMGQDCRGLHDACHAADSLLGLWASP